ncbi:DUF3667 domain-containing protein [Flavobacterium sp. CFS9]|uniref:DUF3667 domain-containing protein n=1 Tax=Flavobacterium sp. CFS9 TaxID=3143118 RepID=UPI0034E8CE5F
MNCKNCSSSFNGKFCNNCGQPADTHQINLHFIWHDIQHGLFHFDKGVFYSLKELYTRPGHTIREFIEGRRVKHFKPVSMIILLATIYGLLYHHYNINIFISEAEGTKELTPSINHWIANHYSWYTLATIPLYTLGTYICFKSQKYNYFEYLVLNTFKASQRLMLHIITFPILLYFNDKASLKTLIYIYYIVDLFLIYWTNFQFFYKLNFWQVLLRSICSHLIMIVSLLIILTSILLITS